MYHVPSLPVVRKRIGAREKIGMSDRGCPALLHMGEIVSNSTLLSFSLPVNLTTRHGLIRDQPKSIWQVGGFEASLDDPAAEVAYDA